MRKQFVLIVCVALAGCVPNGTQQKPFKLDWFGKKPNTKMAAVKESKATIASARTSRVSPGDALDPVIEGPMRVQMDVYQLNVPFGTVSRNENFWKRINEQCVDVATYDVLFKNGVRIGEAPLAEWNHFRKIMAEHPAFTQLNSLVASDGKAIDLPLRRKVESQMLFYYDSTNTLKGRSYDRCENFITMTFQPAPRKPRTVRMALCPVVRSLRKKLEYFPNLEKDKQQMELQFVDPERLYDLNLRADIPIDSFFVVAPSGEAGWPTSLGNNFFVQEAPAEKMETVLLLVPKLVKMDEVTPPLAKSEAPVAKR